MVTESYSNCSEAVYPFFEALTDGFFSGGKEICCFIASSTSKKITVL